MRERLRSQSAKHARPLILGPDLASVVAHPEALVTALRHGADEIVAAQRSIVEAGAEVIVAPTSKTTAPALHQSGQAYRAAALTAAAVDLSRDAMFAARRKAFVVGEIDAEPSPKMRAEARTHVERLATSAVDGVLVRALDHDAAAEIARTANTHALVALVEVDAEEAERAASLLPAGTPLVVRGDVDACIAALERVRRIHRDFPLGMRLVPPGPRADRDRVQTWITSAWSAIAPHVPAIVGVDGPGAVDALQAIR